MCNQLNTLEHGDDVLVAGLVVARQRPETAKGFIFILLEDEAGMINTIVRPDVYERDRIAIRSEPFLAIVGTIAKDDGTVNVLAEEVRPLQVRHPYLPSTTSATSAASSPYTFLKRLRKTPPGSKDWG